MKYQSLPISALRQRFRALSLKLKRSLADGTFQAWPAEVRTELLHKLATLYKRLLGALPARQLRRALGSAALLLGTGVAQAQQFALPVINPFGINTRGTSYFAFPQFADIDGDGDLDLLVRGGYTDDYYSIDLFFYENIGTPEAPLFAEPVKNPFIDGLGEYATSMTFGDLDGDGDLDLLVGTFDEAGNGLRYFENIGTATEPEFGAAQDFPFGIARTGDVVIPFLADLDGDGDLDLLVSQYSYDYDNYSYESSYIYFENTGTPQSAVFGPPQENPFGLSVESGYGDFHVLTDLDGDGDLDLLIGKIDYFEYEGVERSFVQYYENIGTPESPQFEGPTVNPFGIAFPDDTYYSSPTAGDLDGDGDIDLLIFVGQNNPEYTDATLLYFENTTIVSTQAPAAPSLSFRAFPSPVREDLQWSLEEATMGQPLWLEAYDATGQRLLRQALRGEQGSFSVKAWPSGVYFLRITDERGQSLGQQQVVKQ